jgi:hypothetical protein
LTLAGCSPPTGNLSGKVYQKTGQIVPGGRLTFFPPDGRGNPITAEIKEDGSYAVARVPVGQVKITLSNQELDPDYKPAAPVGLGGGTPPGVASPKGGAVGQPPKEAVKANPPPAWQPPPRPPGKYVPLHSDFRFANKSPLFCDVQYGDQTFDIKLPR